MMLRTMALASLLATGLSAQADVISWNQWESGAAGTITTAGTTVEVTFSGELPTSYYADYPSWLPAATYADGTVVENAPTGGIKRLHGGSDAVNAIEFSTPVVNPVMAIWSLGQPSLQARFDFIDATPVFIAGGVSQEYGGSAIVVDGQSVIGNEGNGTVQFIGTFDRISWTNPVSESWYGFNVGIVGAVPEPGTWWLALSGLGLLGWAARRQRRS